MLARWLDGHPDGLDAPALAVLKKAFAHVGIELGADDVERWLTYSLAVYGRCPPTELRLADPASVALTERLAEAAYHARLALDAVEAHAARMSGRPESDRVEVCQFVFPDAEAAKSYRQMLWSLEVASAAASRTQTMQPSRGRPPLKVFHEFAQRLATLYSRRTGERGFVERNGSAAGPLVEVIHEVQQILPKEYHHSDIRTTGKRLLAALAAENAEQTANYR